MLFNQVVIDGCVEHIERIRYTAVGEPLLKFNLKHETPANSKVYRDVSCEMTIQCVGRILCDQVKGFKDDDLVRVKGFLTRNTAKDAFSWIIIEATGLELLKPSDKQSDTQVDALDDQSGRVCGE